MTALKNKEHIKILVLEDSAFYNAVLTRQLRQCTENLSHGAEGRFDIQSFTSPKDFLINLRNDVDMAFLDYYLGEGVTAMEILKKIKQCCPDCCVIIISRSTDIVNRDEIIKAGAFEFIHKDKNTLGRISFILEDFVGGYIQ